MLGKFALWTLAAAGVAVVVSLGFVSTSASASASGASRPSAPRHPTATAVDQTLVVSYQSPRHLGVGPISHYVIELRPGDTLFDCATTRCSIQTIGLGLPYSFTVAAVNRFGVGTYSAPSNYVAVTVRQSTATITFDANGGLGQMASQVVGRSISTALEANQFTRSGFLFIGWNTRSSGSGSAYRDQGSYLFAANLTLYAQWASDAPIVTLVANDGSRATSTLTLTPTQSVVLTSTFSYAGFTFLGWNTSPDGSGTNYGDNTAYTFTNSLSLYALWEVTLDEGFVAGSTSANWAGYVLTGSPGGYQAVSAEWTVPSIDCSTAPSGVTSDWVGVNGWQGIDGLFQDGTTTLCVDGSQAAYAWWTDEAEDYLGAPIFFVSPGDVVDASVYQSSTGYWAYAITDVTTGETSTNVEAYDGAGLSAEWIAEDPGEPGTNALAPLPDFTPVTFSDLGLSVPGGAWPTPTSLDAVAMTGADQDIKALPTALLGGGVYASFTVYFQSSS